MISSNSQELRIGIYVHRLHVARPSGRPKRQGQTCCIAECYFWTIAATGEFVIGKKKNMWAKRFELLHLSISRPKRDALTTRPNPQNNGDLGALTDIPCFSGWITPAFAWKRAI
ncbi:hypothetical protein KL919_000182 [Ogataea angusta]|nr:hypothetical protein KL943_001461 [Ogataea angusta]KAG7864154.1 hypothetical protein KL919_000182 [Ogataea angusta]